MGWPEEEARKKALLAAKAPALWNALKMALKRDVDEFTTHRARYDPSIVFWQPEMKIACGWISSVGRIQISAQSPRSTYRSIRQD